MTKCPLCGYDENRGTTRQEVSMNHYVSKKTGEVCVINSKVEQLTVKDDVLIRKDIFDKMPKTPTPTTPTTPSVPVVTGAK